MKALFNRLKLVIGYIFNRKIGLLFPQLAAIEITNHCNLSCVMCPHDQMTRKKGSMDFTLFQKIVDDLKQKTEFLYLYGTGESLLCKDFFKYADYAVASGMTTCLSTNATMINEEIAEKLIDSGIDFIVLAIDGATQQTYNQIRVGADFHSVIEKCKLLLRAKLNKKAETDINIQLIFMKENANEAKDLVNYFTAEERKAINQFRIKPFFDSYAHPEDRVHHVCPCYFLWNFISVMWDGKVQICCMDYDGSHVIGDLNRENVESIWNGEELEQFRKLHRNLKQETVGICRTCSLPGKKYFSKLTILASVFVDSWLLRKLTPYYEKFYLFKNSIR